MLWNIESVYWNIIPVNGQGTGEREERLVAPPPLFPGFDFRTWGPFLEVSGNLMGPKPYFKMKI